MSLLDRSRVIDSVPKYAFYKFCKSNKIVDASNLKLPATTLAGYCYQQMFSGCKSLTTAPDLPAQTLAIRCYNFMFDNCSSLNYIKMLATDISASDCLGSWVFGVSTTGTFVKSSSATWNIVGNSGVPKDWNVITE